MYLVSSIYHSYEIIFINVGKYLITPNWYKILNIELFLGIQFCYLNLKSWLIKLMVLDVLYDQKEPYYWVNSYLKQVWRLRIIFQKYDSSDFVIWYTIETIEYIDEIYRWINTLAIIQQRLMTKPEKRSRQHTFTDFRCAGIKLSITSW